MTDLFLNTAYFVELTPRERIPLASVEDWAAVMDRWFEASRVSPDTEETTGVWVRNG